MENNTKTFDVMGLNAGDKIKLTNGDIMEFVQLKRTKFIASKDGKNYNVPISMFESVIERIDLEKKNAEKEAERKNVLSTLKNGDWFYINQNNKAITFIFKEIKGKNVIGINPINNSMTKIDINFEFTKIK